MVQEKILNIIKKPGLYGNNIKNVSVIQTHISYVVLTGKYAYKFKKPVNFGFLDFTTLDKRKHFCEEELRLNKRLCPEIYQDVVPITQSNNHIEIAGDGKVIDYAVKMKEFPQESIMTKLLKKGEVDEKVMDKIVDILVRFYKSGKRSEEIDYFGSIKAIKHNTDENFEQTKSFINLTIPKDIFNSIKKTTNKFLEGKKDLFVARVKNGFICDCHGDLHSGNIVVENDDVCIFDCIEFNKRFRFSDVASDIGFLAMDLDFLGCPYLSSYLIERYVGKSGDVGIFDVLNFYKCYRAYVRGKVTGFKLNDSNIDKGEKEEIIKTACKYFDLAYYYSQLFSLDLEGKKPILFITSGLTGTGKTTVARKIAMDYNAKIISTDAVRKELAGIDKFERHHDAYNTGLYSPEKMIQTYKKILEKAKYLLKKDENIVLDATFKTEYLRKKALEVGEKTKASFLILYTVCPEEVVKKYLEERVKKKSISDGRWEIYVKQKDSFESPKYENFIEIDISKISYDYQINVFRKIFDKICEV
ncbi:MAG: AAA family ATPase [Thermoplasmata archaeon M9B1D]|nr:MAG: AAA family ATPase [Thermoplasmata archaeon M9B1D]